MFRLVDAFASVEVPSGLHELLSSAPARMYERNSWTGSLDRGEKPAAIVRTHATDIFAHCLAFAVEHLVLRIAESEFRDYAMLLDPTWNRQASRLGGEFAHRLTKALAAAARADRSEESDARSDEVERNLNAFSKVSQIMYPAISEVRTSLANYHHRDPAMRWLRAIDHALYITTAPVTENEWPILAALAKFLDAAIDGFYPYFLATAFGESVYAQFEG
jgi:hypothetical protein